jgi:hypothetical protein
MPVIEFLLTENIFPRLAISMHIAPLTLYGLVRPIT